VSLDDLARLVSRAPRPDGRHPEARAWEVNVSFLARSLLDRSRDLGLAVKELQRKILLPIELTAHAEPLGPSTLVRLVLTRLSDLSLTGT